MRGDHDRHPDLQIESMRRMVAVSARINADQDLAETLQAVTDGIVEAVGFDCAAVTCRRDGGYRTAAVTGPPGLRETLLGAYVSEEATLESLKFGEPWGELIYVSHHDAIRTFDDAGVPYWTPDVEPSDDPDAWHPEDFLYAPLRSPDGTLIGILAVDLPPSGRKPNQTLCEMLELFAVQAGIAIANANLREDLRSEHEKLEHHATRDWLTGLHNRRVFLDRLAEAIEDAYEHRDRSTLLFCDLDDFKQINDTYGHATGDKVIQEVAERLQGLVRRTDCVARIGGDEFVILATSADQALTDRVHAAIAAPLQACPATVTASVGRVSVRGTENPEAVLGLADLAMYAEKQAR